MPYVNFTPTTPFARAMFDFDWTGGTNYYFNGTIRISVSDAFTDADFTAGRFRDDDLGVDPLPAEVPWPAIVKANIQDTFGVIAAFVGISYTALTDYDSVASGSGDLTICTPADVGLSSDINISLMTPYTEGLVGMSGGGDDSGFGYLGARGDIYVNYTSPAFDAEGVGFGESSKSRQVLMHEILHSLGVSHPFYGDTTPSIRPDYASLMSAGFTKLGFVIETPADLNREYFSIMSYDDESNIAYINAYTPMIMDIIGMQEVYGPGSGTHGAGNDTITAGNVGYRSYFDLGGTDTIDLSLYADGAYVNLGVTITGARHLVGLITSVEDGSRITKHADPGSLRWLYGEFEAVSGSPGADVIVGNGLGNTLQGGAGNDYIMAGSGRNYLRGDDGDDSISGGAGFDDINGNQGNDTCVSGGGDDWVVGGKGNDSLVGSTGQNLVYGNLGDDTCDGGTGNDIVRGGQDNDSLTGGAGDDYVSGDKGNDTVAGGAGADVFHTFGDAGIDRVLDFRVSEGDRVQLDPGTQYTTAQVGDDTVISMTGGGQMILVGVQLSSLPGGWIFGA